MLTGHDWKYLNHAQRLRLVMEGQDIVQFAENPWLLNFLLWPEQKKLLSLFSRRDAMGRRQYNEFWLGAGMRASKTTIGSVISTHEAFKLVELGEPAKHYGLAPGEEIFFINVAINEQQARDTIFAKTKARIDYSPYFQTAIQYEEIFNEFRFPEQNVIIRSGGSNSASIVGRTVKGALFDELPRFQNTSGQRSGRAVFESLSRSVADFKLEGLTIVTGSPLFLDDPFMQLREEAKRNPHALVPDLIPTWELNPKLPFDGEFMTSKRLQNPETFWRDYGCRLGTSITSFYREPTLIKTNPERLNLGELETWLPTDRNYFIYCDPASRLTAYAIAMGYRDGETAVIDLLKRIAPEKDRPVDTGLVCEYLKVLGHHFNVSEFGFDVAIPPETHKKLRDAGFTVTIHTVNKKDYDLTKEKFYIGEVDMCNLRYNIKNQPFGVVDEFRALQLIENKRVDSLRPMDVACAVSGLVWLLFRDAQKSVKLKQPTPFYVGSIPLKALGGI